MYEEGDVLYFVRHYKTSYWNEGSYEWIPQEHTMKSPVQIIEKIVSGSGNVLYKFLAYRECDFDKHKIRLRNTQGLCYEEALESFEQGSRLPVRSATRATHARRDATLKKLWNPLKEKNK